MRHLLVVIGLLMVVGCGEEPQPTLYYREIREFRDRLSEQSPAAQRETIRSSTPQLSRHPDGLRAIGYAYLSIGDVAEARQVFELLAAFGDLDDRIQLLMIIRHRMYPRDPLAIDLETYQEGIAWIEARLAALPVGPRDTKCSILSLLVAWTEHRPEHESALARGFAECRRESTTKEWFERRAQLPFARPTDACEAVVRGAFSHTVVERCLASDSPEWKLRVARALSGESPIEDLRIASRSPDATAYVHRRLADSPMVGLEERCRHLVRAQQIELLNGAQEDAAGIASFYLGYVSQLGCPIPLIN